MKNNEELAAHGTTHKLKAISIDNLFKKLSHACMKTIENQNIPVTKTNY